MTVRALYVDGERIEVTGRGYRPEGRLLAAGEEVPVAPRSALRQLLLCAALCNNAGVYEREDGEWAAEGDPTEAALLVLARKAGLVPEALSRHWPRLGEIPFESERRLMTVVVASEAGPLALTKGAPAEVLGRSTRVLVGGRAFPLDPPRREAALREAEEMAGEGLRVLAFALARLGPRVEARPGTASFERLDPSAVERDLVFLGLAGMLDPLRTGAREAVLECRRAGVRVVMITGDHRRTAEAVAKELGLVPEGRVLTGPELDRWTDGELRREVADVAVFARVSPAHKLRIVRALRARGEVVAMTGDGVNDAPAVREADIGVAMGKAGTEVTKEASAMVLTDDDFATIVAAMREGRAIYDNVRKFVRYLLACNTGEVLLMLVATLLGAPLPLLPIQMLLVNLVTDGLPALALGVDPPEGDVMRRPPRDPKEGIFARGLGRLILVRGAVIGAVSLYGFLLALAETGDLDLARTVAMATLCVSQLMHSFDARSERLGVLEAGVLRNRALVAAALVSFAILCGVIYLPALRPAFHSVPLDGRAWAFVVGLSGAGALAGGAFNLARHVRRRRLLARGRPRAGS